MNDHQAFPLSSSYLCANCDSVGTCANQCPACASSHGLLSLSAILNRDPVAAECAAIMGTFREVTNDRLFA